MFYLMVFMVASVFCVLIGDCVKDVVRKRKLFSQIEEERYVRTQAINEAIMEYNKKKATEKIEPVPWKNEGF